MKLYGLPGGDQVDGLPPAASSGAGREGRRLSLAAICDFEVDFSIFLCFYLVKHIEFKIQINYC